MAAFLYPPRLQIVIFITDNVPNVSSSTGHGIQGTLSTSTKLLQHGNKGNLQLTRRKHHRLLLKPIFPNDFSLPRKYHFPNTPIARVENSIHQTIAIMKKQTRYTYFN